MITEDYVSFETAKLLKEKGFDELTYACFSSDGKEDYYGYRARGNDINRPTLQMAMKWLREVHKIFICFLFLEEIDMYGFTIEDISSKKYLATSKKDGHSTYEQACEAAIKYCLENLI